MASTLIAPDRSISSSTLAESDPASNGALSEVAPGASTGKAALLWLILVGPVAVLAVAVFIAAWSGVGPTWLDLGLGLAFYAVAGHGITAGFHRYLTHHAFRAGRPLRIALAVAGSLAIEGPVIEWVAAHRRHHAHADLEGDPHSPWRFGTTGRALTKGLIWAHAGWLFSEEGTNPERFTPDLLADRDIVRINSLFPLWIAISLLGPGLLGGLISWSWTGALTAFLWAGVVRVFVLHHATFSINSICHVAGSRPFQTRDKSTNCWPLAIVSMGESWHNLHHAEPTCARHGVDRGQVDSTAVLIRGLERLGLASEVRWPNAKRLDRRRQVNSGS